MQAFCRLFSVLPFSYYIIFLPIFLVFQWVLGCGVKPNYEAEQERLKLEIETAEEWVEQRQAMGDDLDAFIALTKKYVDVTELTQTIVNEYIKKIIIHAPDKSGGKRRQTVEIIFNFVDEVEIPVLAEPMIAESSLGRRKTA